MRDPELTVLVTVYHKIVPADLQASLDSIRTQTVQPADVVVVEGDLATGGDGHRQLEPFAVDFDGVDAVGDIAAGGAGGLAVEEVVAILGRGLVVGSVGVG